MRKIQRMNAITKIGAVMVVCGLLAGVGCHKKQAVQQRPPQQVTVAVTTQQDTPIYVDAFGQMSALENVDIVPQVSGKIMAVHFKEGDAVKKDDVLFEIDQREYQAAVDQAKAALAGSKAQLRQSKSTLKRNKKLVEQQLISQEDYDDLKTAVDAAEAQVKADEAALEQAQINLEYCTITSPIDGVTGRRQVDAGNVVAANQQVLVNVKTINPLYVDFSVSERYLDEIRSAKEHGELEVHVATKGVDPPITAQGELKFLDNTVNQQTGTIAMRAEMPNKDDALWAGQFVDVRLIVGTEKQSILAPDAAVQMGKDGPYVFVLKDDSTVDLKLVKRGLMQGDNVVIASGLSKGEKVVTLGQLGLYPGAKAQVIAPDATNKNAAAQANAGSAKPTTKP